MNDFSKGSISSVILKMAVPTIVAQLVNVLYNIVDRVYVGNIPVIGADALTGLGIALPLISLVTAFSNLCGFGGAPLCSIARGRGNIDEARDIMGNSFTLLLISGAVVAGAFFIWLEPLLTLFGASEDTLPYAMGYTLIYLCGTEFVMIALGMNSFINSQGFARYGMLTVLIGAVLNIVLDPLFIFDWGFGMGVRGAALATIISQAVSAVWVLRFLTGKKAIFTLRLASMRLRWRYAKQIMKLGASGFCFGVTNALVQMLTNSALQTLGGDIYVAIMTVASSLRELAMVVQRGLAAGGEPVLGFNYGARCYGRVRRGISFMLWMVLGYSAVASAVIELFPEAMISIFNSDGELLQWGVPALQLYFCMQFMMTFQFVGQSAFVSLNRPGKAVFFSLFRKVILMVPLILILPRLWGLGALGIFLAEPISDLLGGVTCFIVMRLTVWRELGVDGEEAR